MKITLEEDECIHRLEDFYEIVARKAGIEFSKKSRFDCRKILITKPVFNALKLYYELTGVEGTEFSMIFLMYGPKASLGGEDFSAEIEPGFVN